MILAVDIGNSNVTLGVYEGEELIHHWRLSTIAQATTDDLGISVRTLLNSNGVMLSSIEAVVFASVVPHLVQPFERMCARYLGITPLQIAPGVRSGINIKYHNPREVGADRIANAVAAQARFAGPIVVVDFGTATTFDVVDAEGDYAGGAILPGVGISTDALFQRAARLPRIDLTTPSVAIGKNTVDSMKSGIVFGYAGAIDAIINKIEQESGPLKRVIATGGWAGVIISECKRIDEVDPYLTLEGLRIIYMRNQVC